MAENPSTTKEIRLGDASAYAIAVSHGYQGTEAEWIQELMDTSAQAEAAAQSAQDAAGSAEAAAGSAQDAADAKDLAVAAIGEAKNEALGDLSDAKTDAIGDIGDAKTEALGDLSDSRDAIIAEGGIQKQAVSDQGTLEVAAVTGEGRDQVAAVQAQEALSVAAVEAQEDLSVAAVEAKGEEVIQSIPADYTELSGEVSDLKDALAQRTNNLFDKDSVEEFAGFDLTGTVQAIAGTKSVIIPVDVTTQTKVTAHRSILASRFALAAYTSKPVNGASSLYHTYDNNAHTLTITIDSSIKYLMIYLWRTEDSPITFEQMTEGLMVQFGEEFTGYEPYYVPKLADRQITANKLENSLFEQVNSGEIQDILFDSNLNLWGTSLLQVMKDVRVSGYNTTTYVITTASDSGYDSAIMDIPENIDELIIKKSASIPSGGQMYVLISNTLSIASNRPFSALSSSFRDQYTSFDSGNSYYKINLAEARNKGFEKLAISFYNTTNAYVTANKVDSAWLVDKPDIYCPIGAFGSIGAIGDSYTAGSVVKTGGTWVDMPEQSYVAVMAKRAGIDYDNYGKGGANTRSYITDKLADVLSETANDFYFLALGINDSSLGSSYIGTISDIHDDDYTQNADTFYGNYGKIIAQVLEHAPNARFCMIKTPIYLTLGEELDAAIEEIAEHYGFACIDPKDDPFFHSKTFYTRQSNHPSCIGYAGMAMAYERLLSKAIEKDPFYFFYSNIDANIPTVVS